MTTNNKEVEEMADRPDVEWSTVPNKVGHTLRIGNQYTYIESYIQPIERHSIKELIEGYTSSRDTYWKERVCKMIKNNTEKNRYRDGETAFDIVRDITNEDNLK